MPPSYSLMDLAPQVQHGQDKYGGKALFAQKDYEMNGVGQDRNVHFGPRSPFLLKRTNIENISLTP